MKPVHACCACVLVALCWLGRASGQETSLQAVDQGIRVQFDAVQPGQPGAAASFRFQVTDTAGATPLRGLRPAAWLNLRARGAPAPACRAQAAKLLGGDLLARADIDLNSFLVLTLNDDATVSVVDPMFSFGGSRLVNLVQLESPGADWALAPDQGTLFVSLPDAGAVAVIDTRLWRRAGTIRTGPHPRRMVRAGQRIWVADERGVSAIDIATRAVTAVPLAAGAADLAASPDGDWLFAASGASVAVIDAHTARVVRSVAIDGAPTLLAYSHAARAVYAADTRQGKLFAIDPKGVRPLATVAIAPGAAQLRFTPDGRFALLPVPDADLLQVLDAASNQVVHSVSISGGPGQVSFSARIAYVRRRTSEIVLMVQLDQLGNASRALGIADFLGGQKAFGAGGVTLADNLADAPEGGAVLLANAADRMVYLYREGMAAPAGGFRTYAQTPRALLVVDRRLREGRQGVYATAAPVREGGLYDVVFYNDSPRVLACFATNLGAAAAAGEGVAPRTEVRVGAVAPQVPLLAGQRITLRFTLTDAAGRPLARRADVHALAMVPPGTWQRRLAATALPDSRYEIDFIAPEAGMLHVWLASASLGLGLNNPQVKMFRVVPQENSHAH
jgi:hypothetical protein